MAVSTIHVPHAVVTPSNTYAQVTNASISAGSDFIRGTPAGLPSPLFAGIRSQSPAVSFDTRQLSTLFGECTSANLFAADLSGGNTDIYAQKATAFGTRTSGANHQRYRMANAFMYVNSLSLPHNGEGSASVMIVPVYDGTNEPIVPSGSAALAGTSAITGFWGAGPVAINTVTLAGVQSINVDFGISLIRAGGETEGWDTFVAIQEAAPVITIQTLTAESLTTYGLDGTALTAFTAYGRAKSENGGNVANGTTSHISIVTSDGIITVEETAHSGRNGMFSATVRITCSATNSATVPLTISPGVAIT